MVVFLNGRFLPAEQATVSVFDRGFLYGDGLFESVRVYNGNAFLWERHLRRLEFGASLLRIPLPVLPQELNAALPELLKRNQLSNALVRLTVSRGTGPRGYSIQGAIHPTLVMASFPAEPIEDETPRLWRLHTSRVRIPVADPLAAFKSTSKLSHILARAEAEEAGDHDALILNTDGHVAETSCANIFWFQRNAVCTSPTDAGGLDGVTRGWFLDLLRSQGWIIREERVPRDALKQADGVFLTVSSMGIIEVSHLDGFALARSPRLPPLRAAYLSTVGNAASSGRICG